jgi:hypothetical protein
MMGHNDKPQPSRSYAFNLQDLVPQDHPARRIDRFLDLVQEPPRSLPQSRSQPSTAAQRR